MRAVLNATKTSNPNAALNRFLEAGCGDGADGLQRGQLVGRDQVECLLGRGLLDGCLLERRLLGCGLLERRLLDGRFLERCLLERRLLGGRGRGHGHARWIGCPADSGEEAAAAADPDLAPLPDPERRAPRHHGEACSVPTAAAPSVASSSTGAGLAPAPVLTLSGELALGYPDTGDASPARWRNTFRDRPRVTQLRGRFAASRRTAA